MKNQVAKRRASHPPGVQCANHTSASGSTVRPASSAVSRRGTAGRLLEPVRVVGHHARGMVGGVDAAAREDPGTPGERKRRVAAEHQRLEPPVAVAQEDDRRGGDDGREVVGHPGDPNPVAGRVDEVERACPRRLQ